MTKTNNKKGIKIEKSSIQNLILCLYLKLILKNHNNWFNKIYFFIRECFKGKSLVRTLTNIYLLNKKPFLGRGIDFGAKSASSSYYRFLDISNAEMTFTDLYPKNKKVKTINFEEDFDLSNEEFDFAIVIYTLEHIYNYQNFIKNINKSLVKGGRIEGVNPFLHPYHKDPDDYFRYTHTALERILENSNFEDIKITPICQGAFSVMVSMISNFIKFKPLLLLLWTLAILLDYILNKFWKSNLNFYSALAFTAKKRNNT